MIKIDSLRNLRRNDGFERSYAIVRSMKNPSDWLRQLDVLSPSKELFFEYRRMANNGTWGKKAFDEIYVPRFLREMRSPEARAALNELFALDAKGVSIQLGCFCADERLCHRSVIAGLLQGAGANVRLASGADYSAYYAAYRAI